MLLGGGLLALVLVVAIVGWLYVGGSAPPAATPGGAPPGAPRPGQGYLQGTLQAKDFAQRTIFEAQVQAAVSAYESEHGAFPDSLGDLERVPELPSGWSWEYDAAGGKVRIVQKQ